MRSRSLAALCACAAAVLLSPACRGGEEAADGEEAALNQSGAAIPTEAEASALADQAAEAEAADTNAFGGNAAAGQTGNGS
jgi:hypothetical protein